jgi:hypothetical protein
MVAFLPARSSADIDELPRRPAKRRITYPLKVRDQCRPAKKFAKKKLSVLSDTFGFALLGTLKAATRV